MLSKLYYFGDETEIKLDAAWLDATRTEMVSYLGEKSGPVEIEFLRTGTLGVCAWIVSPGHKRFMKTHLPPQRCHDSLHKELRILGTIYQDELALDHHEFVNGGHRQLCIVMDELKTMSAPFDHNDALRLVADYSAKLDQSNLSRELGSEPNFPEFLNLGLQSLEHLRDRELVDTAIYGRSREHLELLTSSIDRLTSCISHGDLGPRNIMAKNGLPIAIDWEDAFIGIRGFDFLYWLTFMDNRKYIGQAFGSTDYGHYVEQSILVLIVVLKSVLSVRSGAYLSHNVSINDRLRDLFSVFEAARAA